MGVYPMQALTQAASTRACSGAWRLAGLYFSGGVDCGSEWIQWEDID